MFWDADGDSDNGGGCKCRMSMEFDGRNTDSDHIKKTEGEGRVVLGISAAKAKRCSENCEAC